MDRTTFLKLSAGTYAVKDWKLKVFDHTEGGTLTPMLLIGKPPSYTTVWIGSPFDPTSNGIQTVKGSGAFTLASATNVYAGFFTAGTGSGIIALDQFNEGNGRSRYDHTNSFKAPTGPGQAVATFTHPDLERTYAFEINVIPGDPASAPPPVVAKTPPQKTAPAKPAPPKAPPKPPVVAKKTNPKPAAPASTSPFPVSFKTPSTTVQPSIASLSTFKARTRVNEDELEFRFWRNVKLGKALNAAVIDVDSKSGHMHLYLPGGKNYVVAIADYHEEDKVYLMDWISWQKEMAKREETKTPTAAKSLPAAPNPIADALSIRLRTDSERGKVKSGETQNTYPTKHEVTVQVVTSTAVPPKIPKGQLHLTAYVSHSLSDARMNGETAVAAYKSDSSSLKKIALPPKPIDSFKPGETENKVFSFKTDSVKGRGTRKDGKKTLSYRWTHDQTLIGVEVRLMVGGKVADRASYPSDLDRRLEEIRKR